MFISKEEKESIHGQLDRRWENHLSQLRMHDNLISRFNDLSKRVDDLVCFVFEMGYTYNPNGHRQNIPMFEKTKKEKKNG